MPRVWGNLISESWIRTFCSNHLHTHDIILKIRRQMMMYMDYCEYQAQVWLPMENEIKKLRKDSILSCNVILKPLEGNGRKVRTLLIFFFFFFLKDSQIHCKNVWYIYSFCILLLRYEVSLTRWCCILKNEPIVS